VVPGYQLVRQKYRALTEINFRNRRELQEWVRSGMELQERLQLEPMIFNNARAYVRSRDGIEFLWDPDLLGGALDLEFGSDFERLELECVLSQLARIETEKIVFIDIGGNCGLYALSVARRFPNSHSYSFEPVPSTRALLHANARHNGLASQITIVDKALGDDIKTVKITASYSAMDHLVVGNATDELSPLILEVPMTTLDQFVLEQDLTQVDFIKCDVEGAELLVFSGARETLPRYHPPVLLEIESKHTERFGYVPDDLDRFLRGFGYTPWKHAAAKQTEPLSSLREGMELGLNNFLYLCGTQR